MDLEKLIKKGKIEVVEEKPFHLEELKAKEKGDIEEFEKILTHFFKVKDKYDLSKTDIPAHLLNSLVTLIFFAKNPLPVYNRFLREQNKEIVKIEDLEDFLKLYIHARISVERKGRQEGVEIARGVIEKLKEKVEEKEEEVKKIYERLLR